MSVAVRVSALIAVMTLAAPASAQIVNPQNTSGNTASSSATSSSTPTSPSTLGAQGYIVPSEATGFINPASTGGSSNVGGGSGGGGRSSSGSGSASGGTAASPSGTSSQGTVTTRSSASSTASTTVTRQPNWLVCPSGGPSSGVESALLGSQLTCSP